MQTEAGSAVAEAEELAEYAHRASERPEVRGAGLLLAVEQKQVQLPALPAPSPPTQVAAAQLFEEDARVALLKRAPVAVARPLVGPVRPLVLLSQRVR